MEEDEREMFCPLECGARINNLQKHLKKCRRKQELMVNYIFCEYNSAHIIKKELYSNHLYSDLFKYKGPNEDDQNKTSEGDELDELMINIINEEDIEHRNLIKDELIVTTIEEAKEKNNQNPFACIKQKDNNYSNIKRFLKQKTTILYDKEEDIDVYSKTFFQMVYKE